MRAVGTVLLVVGLLIYGLFLVLYTSRSAWRSTGVGRLLVALALVLVGLLGLRLWGRLWGPLGDTFWSVAFGCLDLVGVWLLVLLRRAQRRRP